MSIGEAASDPEPPLLHIQTLGRFTVLRGGSEIPAQAWGTHRAKALLKLLLTQRGRPLRKEQIIEHLWPESSPRLAVQSLYTAVSDLRRALEPGLVRPATSAFVRSGDGSYRFDDRSPHRLDVAEFEALIAQARVQQDAQPSEAAQSYARAFAIYAGDYLPDDLYAPWSEGERQRLRTALLRAFVDASQLELQLGHPQVAVAHCRQALAIDPCFEEIWQLLIDAYQTAGEPALALRAYKECAETLERELGIAPTAEMQALGARLAALPAQLVPPASKISAKPPLPVAAGFSSCSSSSPFVGRVGELAQLTAALERAAGGQGRVVFIVGESGIGKSALVTAALAAAPGRPVARGHAHELTQGLAYHPLAGALRDIGRAEELSALSPRQRAQIARLTPELVPDALPALPSALDERTQLFEALRGALWRQDGLTIVLEDLHWADDGTLAFLAFLAPQLYRSTMLIIATCRPSEALAPLLGRGGREPWMETVPLGPFDEGESAVLVAAQLGQPGSQALGQRLHRASGGNPLYLLSVLDRLQAAGQLRRAGDGRWIGVEELASAPILPVPDEVAALVERRAAPLDASARRLLHAAAVLDQPCAPALLSLVAREAEGELTNEALVDGIDALLDAGLLRTLPDETLAITHDALREAIYARLNPLRRQRLHAIAAAAFTIHGEATRQSEVDAVVGEHLLRSEQWQAAVSYLLRAGDAAARLHAYAEAGRHFERALQALDRLPAHPDLNAQQVEILLRLDLNTYVLDLGERPLERLERAERLARAIAGEQGQRLRAEVALALGRAYLLRSCLPVALARLKEAHDSAAALGDRSLAAVVSSSRGAVLFQQGYFDKAEGLLLRAVTPLERARSWNYWLVAIAYHAIGMAMRGALTGARAEAQRSLTYAERAGHVRGRVIMHATLCWIGVMSNDTDTAATQGAAALALAEENNDVLRWGLVNELLAWSASRNGDHQRADLHLAAVEALRQRVGALPFYNDWWSATAAERALVRGDAAQAMSLAQAALAQAQAVEAIFSAGLAHRVWGQALAEQGDLEGAKAQLARAVHLFETGGARLELARARLAWGRAYWRHNAIDAAREQWQQASLQFAASGLMREHAEAQKLLAMTERRR